MLQLCLAPLRTPRGLNLFKVEYERNDYDIDAWRKSCRWISKRDTAVLDADDGAGELHSSSSSNMSCGICRRGAAAPRAHTACRVEAPC
jgi:hypothetical protein